MYFLWWGQLLKKKKPKMFSSGKDSSRKVWSFANLSVYRRKPASLNIWVHTYWGAELARISPVPILCKVLLGAGLALCGSISRAVSFHGCAWRALVTHQEGWCHRVKVLVFWWVILLLEGPGKGSGDELQEKNKDFNSNGMKIMLCIALSFFFFVLERFPTKLPVNQSSQKGHSCKIKGPAGEGPEATSPCSTEVSSGRTSICRIGDRSLHIYARQSLFYFF